VIAGCPRIPNCVEAFELVKRFPPSIAKPPLVQGVLLDYYPTLCQVDRPEVMAPAVESSLVSWPSTSVSVYHPGWENSSILRFSQILIVSAPHPHTSFAGRRTGSSV